MMSPALKIRLKGAYMNGCPFILLNLFAKERTAFPKTAQVREAQPQQIQQTQQAPPERMTIIPLPPGDKNARTFALSARSQLRPGK